MNRYIIALLIALLLIIIAILLLGWSWEKITEISLSVYFLGEVMYKLIQTK